VAGLDRQAMTVILVEDDPGSVLHYRGALESAGHTVLVAGDRVRAWELLREPSVDVVLVELMFRGAHGFAFAAEIRSDPRTAHIPLVVIGPFESLESRVRAIHVGAEDFLSKSMPAEALLARLESLARFKWLGEDLERTESVVTLVARTVEVKDGFPEEHPERVALNAVRLGRAVGCDEETCRALWMAGLLHDLGKISVPEAVLTKSGPLTPDERVVVQQHSVAGAELCQLLRRSSLLVPMIRHHHERLDGSGYPDGLCGSDIPLGAQVVSVADFYDVCISDRPYRKARPRDTARELLQAMAEQGKLSPSLVVAFLEIVDRPGESDPPEGAVVGS